MNEQEVMDALRGKEGSKAVVMHRDSDTPDAGIYFGPRGRFERREFVFVWRDPVRDDPDLIEGTTILPDSELDIRVLDDVLHVEYHTSGGAIGISPRSLRAAFPECQDIIEEGIKLHARYDAALKAQGY